VSRCGCNALRPGGGAAAASIQVPTTWFSTEAPVFAVNSRWHDTVLLLVERLPGNPILTPESHPSLGANLNGPSLIRAPGWLDRPLGRYYLYFAHHKGAFIRLAVVDSMEGPWRVHAPGAFHLSDSRFPTRVSVGDQPERILRSRITLRSEWTEWSVSEAREVLRPERSWEGAELPLAASVRGAALEPMRQLRDPGIFEEEGQTWLLYSVAGGSGIALARLESEAE
jgi:hypothetical protein